MNRFEITYIDTQESSIPFTTAIYASDKHSALNILKGDLGDIQILNVALSENDDCLCANCANCAK